MPLSLCHYVNQYIEYNLPDRNGGEQAGSLSDVAGRYHIDYLLASDGDLNADTTVSYSVQFSREKGDRERSSG